MNRRCGSGRRWNRFESERNGDCRQAPEQTLPENYELI